MAVSPIAYVSQTVYTAQAGGDATPDTDKDLSMPALSATCINVAIVFTASGLDWDGAWTFYDSDGTQDTDFAPIFNNAGDGGGHNDLQVYCRTYEASKYDNKILNVRYDDGGPAGATFGRMVAQWWENVKQVPSCDIIMSTGSTSGHAPMSTNSAMVSIGVAVGYNDDVAEFAVWGLDATELYNSSAKGGASSDDNRSIAAMCWANPADTSSSDYLIDITVGAGAEEGYTFEIFPYEVVLSNITGTLVFSGSIDKKLSLTRFLAGTLSFTQGILVAIKYWKMWTTAIVEMWLAPNADPINLDVSPKGFTDIGEE